MFKKYRHERKQKKRRELIMKECGCLCYCPHCRDYLNDQASYEETGHGFVTYICSSCGEQSVWNFDICPIPLLIDKLMNK